MKRIVKCVVLLIFLFLIFNQNGVTKESEKNLMMPVSTYEETENEFNKYIDNQLAEIDLTELEEYVKNLTNEEKNFLGERDIKSIIKEIYSGEFKLDYSSHLSSVVNLVFKDMISMIPSFAMIVAVCMVLGIFNSLQSGLMENGTSRLISFVCYSAVVLLIFSLLLSIIDSSYTSVEKVQKQIDVFFPIILTLMALSGGSVSVAIYQPSVAFLGIVIVKIITNVVFPLTVLVLVLGLVSGINNDIKLKNFCDFFLSANKWILGITLTSFTVFFTLQGLSSSGFDGISFKAIKYAINNSVPLVGGFVSSGFDLIVASSIIIKDSLGLFAVLMLISVVLKPLLYLIAFNLFVKFTSAIIEPLGDGNICSLLVDLSKNTGTFIAGILCVVFMYILMILLMVISSSYMV